MSDAQDLTASLTVSLTERLAVRLARPVDAATRARARLHLLDWLACVAGGRREPVAEIARAAEPDALTRAALLGNLLEMDDVDRLARLHPGPVVWPAALSAARDEGCTMGTLLDGAVRGYEAMIALGRALDAHHYAHWHPTATAGGFGAVAAAGSIYALDAAATVAALGNAGSIAGGLWRARHEAVMTKALHVAHSALAGVWTARLARRGFTGPRLILEGEQGLFGAMTATPAPEAMAGGDGWRIFETSFKPYPACRHAHPAIDAALALGDALSSGPIVVATYRDALVFCDRPTPTTPAEAKFSLQHAVAVVACRGVPTLADFEPDAIADPQLAAARARVSVVEAAALTAAYPAHFGATVGAGGRDATVADALGDPENAIGAEAIAAKLRALAAWGGVDAEAALALDLSDGAPVGPLLDMLEAWTA